MRAGVRVVCVLAGAVTAWLALAPWIHGGSERFYVLVPLVTLVAYALLSPMDLAGLRPYLRPFLVCLLTGAAACGVAAVP